MNNNRGNNRRRGRGNNNNNNNNSSRPQSGGQQINRIDSRARGNAPQMLEKYRKLAQDAHLNGDRVQAEYYLQFADHYFRVTADTRVRQEEARLRQSGGQPYGQAVPAGGSVSGDRWQDQDGEDDSLEFGIDSDQEALHSGGYEITDKSGKREIFIRGAMAEIFRENVRNLIASEPSVEDIDDFLGKYDAVMGNRVVYH